MNPVDGVRYAPLTYSGKVVNAPYTLEEFSPAASYGYTLSVSRIRNDDGRGKPTPRYRTGCDRDYFFVNIPWLAERGVCPEDIARIAMLAAYVTHDKLELFDDNRLLTPKRIRDTILQLSPREFGRFETLVRDLKILRTSPSGKYALSGDVITRGYRSNKLLPFKLYRFPYRALYSQTAPSKHRYIGYVISHLHLLNPNWNTFCLSKSSPSKPNTSECDPVNLIPASMSDVCNMIGLSKSNSSRLFDNLLDLRFDYAGMERRLISMVKYDEPSMRRFICVNPIVTHAGVNWSAAESFGGFFPRAVWPDRAETFEDVLRELGCL